MATIPRPGVEVIQQIATTTPTIARPQLVPCIVGPCYEILTATDATGAVNANALVSVPASITAANTSANKTVAGLTVVVAVNGGADQTYTFPTSTSNDISATLCASLLDANLTGVTVTLLATNQLVFTTVATGDGSSLNFSTSGTAHGSAGIDVEDFEGYDTKGTSTYDNEKFVIPFSDYPTDKGDASKMSFDTSNLNIYYLQSGVLKLIADDEALLRHRKSYEAPTESYLAYLRVGTEGADTAMTFVSNNPVQFGSEITITFADGAAGITESNDDITITDDFTGGITSAALVAKVNADTDSNVLVTAYVHDDGAGTVVWPIVAGTGGISGAGPHRLVPLPATYTAGEGGPKSLKAHTGKIDDDGDTDSTSPYFYGSGGQASITIGAGNSGITLTAKGDQDSSDQGDFHGAAGNNLTVFFDDQGAIDPKRSGNALTIEIDSGVSTAAAVVTAINSGSVATHAGSAVVASLTGDGSGVVTLNTIANLTGGYDPPDFGATQAKAVVLGERYLGTFNWIRVDYTIATGGPFLAGEVLKQTDTDGDIIGTIQVVDTTNLVLWVDTTSHVHDPAAGETIFSASATATVDSAVQNGTQVALGDTLTVRFDTKTVGSTIVPGPEVTVTFADNTTLLAAQAEIETALDAVSAYGPGAYTKLVDPEGNDDLTGLNPLSVIRLEAVASNRAGIESTITLGGTAVEKIFGNMPGGATFAGTHEGTPHKVKVGDALYDGTTLLGNVIAIDSLVIGALSFATSRLKLDTELALTNTYSQWWIQAKNITMTGNEPDNVGGDTRPMPGLYHNSTTLETHVTQNFARNSDGTLATNAAYNMYAAYTALRTDVGASATNPALQTFETTTELESSLGPIDPANPLTYAMYLAMLNASSIQVSGLGIDATSTTEPQGTLAAYTAAAEFLEAQEVYAVAACSQARDVHNMFAAHVAAMSAATVKKERIYFLNEVAPTEKAPTLVGTGTGTLTSLNTVTVDAGTLDVEAAFTAEGYDTTTMVWSDFKTAGAYLENTTDAKKYSISLVVGQVISLTVSGFEPGENDDNFYATANLDPNAVPPGMAVGGESVTIKLRGAAIDSTTTAGRNEQVDAMVAASSNFVSRRVFNIQPDQMGVTFNGSEQLVDGYFAAAAIAGMVGQQHPSQGFTNLPMVGFTRPKNSNDRFSETQLNTGAGGGVWWIVQDVAGGAVKSRHQLATDITSVEKRELSITKALDFGAKILRGALASYIGKFNITDKFLDTLSIIAQGVLHFLVDTQVWRGADINNIVQDTDNPDTVLLDISVQALYPSNYIRISLIL